MSFVKAFLFVYAFSALQSGVNPIPPVCKVEEPPVRQTGIATWYGDFNWHGTHTADGDLFRPYEESTCAHRTLPLGTMIMVEDPDTGRRVWCEVTDRGPYAVMEPSGVRKAVLPQYQLRPGERWHGFLDMSAKAAKRLGTYEEGLFRARIRYWVPDTTIGERAAFASR